MSFPNSNTSVTVFIQVTISLKPLVQKGRISLLGLIFIFIMPGHYKKIMPAVNIMAKIKTNNIDRHLIEISFFAGLS